MPGGVRTRGGRGGRRGRGVRIRGGAQDRPHVSEEIDLGLIEEIRAGSPLEVPLHPPKRRRYQPHTAGASTSGIWQPTIRDAEGDAAGGNVAEGDVAVGGNVAVQDGGIQMGDNPPSPSVYVECTTSYTPRARVIHGHHRRLQDAEIDDFLNYGSEEEDNMEDGVDGGDFMLPRALQMFFEPDVDTSEEAEAAGLIDVPQVPCSSQVDPGVSHDPTTLFDFSWRSYPSDPISPVERREVFVGDSGPTIERTTDPYDIFIRIWDSSIMGHIVTQTNLYAQEHAANLLNSGLMGPHSRISKWVDVNIYELYVYFGILLAMGVLVKSKMEEYWCKEGNIFTTPNFAGYMSLARFQLINRCLHFNDNTLLTPELSPKEAKLFKIAPLVTHLNSKFSSLFHLDQNVALDESLTQWKGWLNIKQYIPNKKSAVGIKTYEVCDSRTGYLWRFEVHTGPEIQSSDSEGILVGGIPNLVLRLLSGLEHSGRTIWMDNYYNSPSLARVLKTLGLDCVGTLRTNRQFVPSEIVALKKGNMRIGQVCGCTSGDVDLMVWRDQNKVAMISTYHGVAVSDGR